jgi:hypothetical protein
VEGTPSYKNAITNELFFTLAAELYLASGSPTSLYWAKRQLKWLLSSGMRGSQGLFNDGLRPLTANGSQCENNNQTTWTYNQGVILGGCATLYRATKDNEILSVADSIASSAISHLTRNGVLTESCEFDSENGCNGDAAIFKGVFVRHLWYLTSVAPQRPSSVQFRHFLQANVESLVQVGPQSEGLYGISWSTASQSSPASHSAALDLLVASSWPSKSELDVPFIQNCTDTLWAGQLGAWIRPAYRCFGPSVELLPRGSSLAECLFTCARTSSCGAYTWTYDGEEGTNSICNVFFPNASAAVCSLDITHCAASQGGCRYVSGASRCLRADEADV